MSGWYKVMMEVAFKPRQISNPDFRNGATRLLHLVFFFRKTQPRLRGQEAM